MIWSFFSGLIGFFLIFATVLLVVAIFRNDDDDNATGIGMGEM